MPAAICCMPGNALEATAAAAAAAAAAACCIEAAGFAGSDFLACFAGLLAEVEGGGGAGSAGGGGASGSLGGGGGFCNVLSELAAPLIASCTLGRVMAEMGSK